MCNVYASVKEQSLIMAWGWQAWGVTVVWTPLGKIKKKGFGSRGKKFTYLAELLADHAILYIFTSPFDYAAFSLIYAILFPYPIFRHHIFNNSVPAS